MHPWFPAQGFCKSGCRLWNDSTPALSANSVIYRSSSTEGKALAVSIHIVQTRCKTLQAPGHPF